MKRAELILAAMAPAERSPHTPVQIQKLIFVIDDKVSEKIGAERFAFAAYDYGPFDKAVYDELDGLASVGKVEMCVDWPTTKYRVYRLTEAGQAEAEQVLAKLPEDTQAYIRRLSSFVRSLSFSALVSAIYKAYPEMKENSVFQTSS